MRSCFALFVGICLGSSSELRGEKIVLIAGGNNPNAAFAAQKVKLNQPFGVDFDRIENRMYIIEMVGERLLRMDLNGNLTTIAGNGQRGDAGDGGPATQAKFNGAHSLAVHRGGDVYVADTWNHRVRRIEVATGVISTVAGTGKKGFNGDGGPALQAEFGGIYCIAFNPSQNDCYIADLDNRRIRVINTHTGIVRTVAGNGQRGVPNDGALATDSPLVDPRAVAVDGKGNVYILERSGHALRVVDATGRIRTVVGTGKPGAAGDSEDARTASLNSPKHLCVDRDGNVLIADSENHVIRKYLPREGKILRIAGTGKKGEKGIGGPPMEAELNAPHGVAVHPSAGIYIADSSNHRVLRIIKDAKQ